MSCIFISYRRDDSAYAAHQLRDRLVDHFGIDNIIFDVESIPLGTDFRNYITEQITKCDVLLAVMGNEWLTSINARSGDPKDFVRIEIEAALKRDIPVIPVLVEKAVMPDDSALPKTIADLAYRNATEVRAGADYHAQLDRLVTALENLLGVESTEEIEPVKPPPVAAQNNSSAKSGSAGKFAAAAVLLIAILGAGAFWFPTQKKDQTDKSHRTSEISTGPEIRVIEAKNETEKPDKQPVQIAKTETKETPVTTTSTPHREPPVTTVASAQKTPRIPVPTASTQVASPNPVAVGSKPKAARSLESQCFNMVQGKIAWNKKGTRTWNSDNIKTLCSGTTDPSALIACFQVSIQKHDDWNRAISDCKTSSQIGSRTNNYAPKIVRYIKVEPTNTVKPKPASTADDYTGTYENHLYDKAGKNDWHFVTITKMDDSSLRWANRAGVSWSLKLTADPNVLNVDSNAPYYKQGFHSVKVQRDATGQIIGLFGPSNELYQRESRQTRTSGK